MSDDKKTDKKLGIVIDKDFALKNSPPYPRPMFLSFENPYRIKFILDFLEKNKVWENENIVKLTPKNIDESILELTHTKYYINTIERFSRYGSGLLDEELFITSDTFALAKKAIGGAIEAVEKVVRGEVNQSIALIRPPGHHALKEKGSGLCIFNNIATSIFYLRKELSYHKKIAIVDIDDHFGDGIVQYFYSDPSVLYFSIHEFDFVENDVGFIDELGIGEGLGKSINFPVPMGIKDDEFLIFLDTLEPILNEYKPDLIIVAAGFDMHFSDPIGNCNLTSNAYFSFTKRILGIAEKICEGKITFILEGGYSLIALPICVHAVIQALLKSEYEPASFEKTEFSIDSQMDEIIEIKTKLENLLEEYWPSLKK